MFAYTLGVPASSVDDAAKVTKEQEDESVITHSQNSPKCNPLLRNKVGFLL